MEKMLSVTEYAELTGKDPGNIRRMLAAGRLKGSKGGGRWVIPYGTEYPEDRREKTGRYRNWRRKIQLHSHKELMATLRILVRELTEVYGELLKEIILYGSYARGDQSEESDVDIALILDGLPTPVMTEEMTRRTAAKELESGKVLSVLDIQADKYNTWKRVLPFYQNIEKEGIVLWKEP